YPTLFRSGPSAVRAGPVCGRNGRGARAWTCRTTSEDDHESTSGPVDRRARTQTGTEVEAPADDRHRRHRRGVGGPAQGHAAGVMNTVILTALLTAGNSGLYMTNRGEEPPNRDEGPPSCPPTGEDRLS